MSWYNKKDNDFIDGTQEYASISSNITIINNGDIGGGGGGGEGVSDLINLRVDDNNKIHLYLNNTNEDGEIRFYTENAKNVNDYNYNYLTSTFSEPRLEYNTKIDKDGLLQYYHTYNILAPFKLSGWYEVGSTITSLEIGAVVLGAGVATVQAEIVTIDGALVVLNGDYQSFKLLTTEEIIDLYNLLHTLSTSARGLAQWRNTTTTRELFDSLWNQLGGVVNTGTSLGGSTALPIVRTIAPVTANALRTWTQRYSTGVTYSVIGAGIYGIYALLDSERESNANETLLLVSRIRLDGENEAGFATDSTEIYKGYLQIDPLTNSDFTTIGFYEVNIQKGAKLTIEIFDLDPSAGVNLKARIINVLDNGSGFAVNESINISKNDLGGSTSGGNLTILVTNLATNDFIFSKLEEEVSQDLIDSKNRQRRRQLIPNKNDFNNGFSITETTELQDSGEELPSIAIDLKINTDQFEYDNSGNLQLKNFSTISEIGTLQNNLGVPSSIIPAVVATGLNLDVETLREEVGDNISIPKKGIHKSIDDIFNLLGTIPDYDANGEVVDLATGIYARIDNIYKVVMEEGFTFDNNTDYKLSLGYDVVWNGFYYNLFCVALKTIRSGPFSSSFYGNDYMGLFPSLERVADKTTEYLLVKDTGIELLTNFHIKRGVLYFNNVNPTIDYDLARKFEFVTFLTPKNIDNLDVEYSILQTGVEISPNTYDIDNNKLKLSIINNKLNITNYIYYNSYYFQSLTTTLFNTYMLATFSSTGSFNLPSSIGFKEAVNVIAGREHSIGIKSIQVSPTEIPTDQTWFNIVRSNGTTSSFYYWNFAILRDMTFQPQPWKSPVFYYNENLPLPANRNNFSKIKIRYDYEKFTTGSGWSSVLFGSQNAIDIGLEFKMKITRKKYDDPNNSFGSILVDFNQISKVSGEIWYEMDIWIDNNSPIATLTKYNWVELELVHKGGSFTPLPSGTQSYDYYNNQHRIKVYTFGVYEYDTTANNISNWKLHTFEDDVNEFFPTPIQQTTSHKVVFNLDLPNKIINYYVDNVGKALTLQDEISIIGTSFANEDPNQTNHPATFVFANNTHTSLTLVNNILIIGNEQVAGELNYTHFNWKFIPNGGSEDFMTLSQRNKLDELITYNYYYETVTVPRYLKTKELYADVFDARRLLINGGALYNDLSPAEQETRLRTNDQSTGDVLIGNSFLEIGKLFVDNPTISGNLTYDFDTRTFSITEGASINTEDVENIIDGLIKTTPSTYGLIFNDTDVNDKYLQLDNTYINTLINLVLQNEVSYNTGFTDVKFFDLLIQVKDASIYSPYNLRELVDVNTLYNYVINGSHNYLIRELNQLVQYHPLLGLAFGDYLPTGSFNFNGILAEDQGNTAIDFEVVDVGAQITYGDGYNNNKLQNGLSGGLSYIQNINVFPFSDGLSGCISCFHKPYGSFISNNVFEVTDVNEVNLLRLRVGYTSGFARYVLDVFNQNNTNFTQYIFNNSENEVYYENENSIVIYYDFPNINMYVNGFKHDGVITTYTNQTFQNARFKINTSTYNDKSLLYELKVYDRLLFKSNDDIFNFKRVAEITEFYRISPISGSGLIIKELSGVQETKSRSITNKQTIETLESNTYTDAKVRTVLSASGGNNITWNTGTNKFDSTVVPYEDSDVETYLQNKAGVGMTYNTITQLFDCDITQYTDAFVEGYIKTKGGVNITYNLLSQKFDCDIIPYTNTDVEGYIKTKGGVGITYNPTTKKFDNDITQYEDSDVETYLQGKAGVGMTYNTNTQLFDCDIIEYTNTDLETALKLKGGIGMKYNVGASKFDCLITQYTNTDVRSILAVSDGEGITWDAVTNKFKLAEEIVTLANQYNETDVENLLATKGGTNIYYNPTTKQFDNSITGFDQLSGTITYATIFDPPDLSGFLTLSTLPTYPDVSEFLTLSTLPAYPDVSEFLTLSTLPTYPDVSSFLTLSTLPAYPDVSTFITLGDIPVQYSTTILESDLANKAGNLIDWNNTSKQFDVNIPNGTYAIPSEIIPQVQSDFNEINTNSPAFIANLPNILTKIASTIGGNNTYQSDFNHLFRNSLGESSFAIYDSKIARFFGDITLADNTTLTTAPLQSDFNENNNSSLAYIQNKPTLPSLLSNESGVILNLNGLTFTNPNAFIKEGAMQINGTTYSPASTTTIVEDFSFASGSINTTISGLNPTFFTNGILGSQAALPGGVGYNLGQISGLYNTNKSEFRFSGSGTGTAGDFNSSAIGYSKFFCFNGGAYRSLRTKNIQSIMGDIVSLSFYWIAGNNSNGGNRPETNENFELQFLDSFGNLMSSILIHAGSVLYPNVANFTFYSLNLNATQQQSSYIRWFQLNTSSGPFDQYAFTGLKFTFQIAEAGGADVRLINLPTVEPSVPNKLWRDPNGFLKIS